MSDHVDSASPIDIPVRGIPGVVEWVLENAGTVKQFNPHVLLCEVRGLECRYFVTEGWVGVKTKDCPSGKSVECLTLQEFVSTVIENTPNAKVSGAGTASAGLPGWQAFAIGNRVLLEPVPGKPNLRWVNDYSSGSKRLQHFINYHWEDVPTLWLEREDHRRDQG